MPIFSFVIITSRACIWQMQKLPGYSGPTLGPKEATANKREFTEAQLQEAKGATTFLGKGSAVRAPGPNPRGQRVWEVGVTPGARGCGG